MSTPTDSETTTEPVPLRKNRDFVRLWLGAGMSHFAATVGMVAFPLLALWETGSAVLTGWVAFASQLATLLIQLPAGALVDRWDRRKLMLTCDIIGAFAIASVAVAVYFDAVWIPHLMVAAFLESTRGIFYDLAERAAVRNVVSREQLPAALSQNEARGSAIGLIGQPIGSALFTLTRWLPFVFSAIADLIAVVLVLFIRRGFRTEQAQPRRRLHVEIGEGIRWAWQEKFARVLIGLFAGSNFIFQVVFLTVLLIIHSNNNSPALVGVITAVGGVGGFAGALLAPWWIRRVSMRTTWILGYGTWTLLIPAIAFVRDPVLLAAIFAGNSLVGGVLNVAGWTFQVQNTPEHLQGRVNGAARFLCSGANAAAGPIGGYLLDHAGIGWTGSLLGGAVLLLTIAAASNRAMRGAPPKVDISGTAGS
jgi:MFS family permease